RFFMIVPTLAIAGNLAQKKYVPPSLGTFPVTTPLFTLLLIGVILIVGALTFFPALSLGPILEHLQMMAGRTFGTEIETSESVIGVWLICGDCNVGYLCIGDDKHMVHPGVRFRLCVGIDLRLSPGR